MKISMDIQAIVTLTGLTEETINKILTNNY